MSIQSIRPPCAVLVLFTSCCIASQRLKVHVHDSVTIPCGNSSGNTTYSTIIGVHVVEANHLHIPNITTNYHGSKITCYAGGSLMASYIMDVSYAPTISTLHHVPLPVVGDHFMLICPINGNPTPTITWHRYSDIDMDHTLPLPPQASNNTSSWSVYQWQEDYNGYYVCCGSNTHGNICYTDIARYRLFAYTCDTVASHPHAHTYRVPNKETYVTGATVAMTCIVSSVEQSLWQPVWYYHIDNRSVGLYGNSTSNYNSNTCSWNTTIVLYNIDSSKAGKYTCVYHNTVSDTTITIADTDTSLYIVGVVAVAMVMIYLLLSARYHVTKDLPYRDPPYDQYQWDVFLSYHREVEQYVQTYIKQYLECRGYSVCWHHVHFTPGSPIVDNIQHCVTNSRKVVLIISDNFINSSHCMTELRYSLHRVERTGTRCLLPIALTNTVPQELKTAITYWPVFDRCNTDAFHQQLVKYIGRSIATNV